MAKKECYRVQIGSGLIFQMSKCFSKSEANSIAQMIEQGRYNTYVIRWEFPKRKKVEK